MDEEPSRTDEMHGKVVKLLNNNIDRVHADLLHKWIDQQQKCIERLAAVTFFAWHTPDCAVFNNINRGTDTEVSRCDCGYNNAMIKLGGDEDGD